MKTNRRNFFKTASIAGAGALASSFISGCTTPSVVDSNMNNILESVKSIHKQIFNMSGYAAPALSTVRVGLVGLGDRGSSAIDRLVRIEGVRIVALCDKREKAVKGCQSILQEFGLPAAKEFFGNEDSWKEMIASENIDLVYICTPWHLHTAISLAAMESDKHVACEVPIALTVDDAWRLVETSERTKKHCMMLENCCYDFFELLTLNMARQGMFGDLVHGEGAYIHNLMSYNFLKPDDDRLSDGAYTDMWRLKENGSRNGNLYPTHGLGPICQVMSINRGDKMEYLTSMSSNDYTMGAFVDKMAQNDDFYQPYSGKTYRGNMSTTTIKTNKGRTIMIQHDVSSVRPYSRIHLVSGTLGMAVKYPYSKIALGFDWKETKNPSVYDWYHAPKSLGHSWLSDEDFNAVEEEFTPEIIKRVGEMAKEVGGHGGMDFIMDWRLVDCLRNGLPLDQDVYDGALWSVISPLSEWSVANRSQSIDVPDFTCGSWNKNVPHGINLETGGTTNILKL